MLRGGSEDLASVDKHRAAVHFPPLLGDHERRQEHQEIMGRSDDIPGRGAALAPSGVGDARARPSTIDAASAEDRALIARLLAGDEAAFAGLIEEHHGRLVRLARSFVKDQATAEEVVQETWIGVLNGLGTFEGRSALKTWIFRILVNRAKTRGV